MKSADATIELIEALNDAGIEAESYSGRGMFGKCCVSVKNESEWKVAKALAGLDAVAEPCRDQLGRGIVLYWPNYEWPPP